MDSKEGAALTREDVEGLLIDNKEVEEEITPLTKKPIIIQNRRIRRLQHRKAARNLWKITQGKAPVKEDLMKEKKPIKEAWND